MLVLSPRAVERLLSYRPAWPLPKVFRLTSGGNLIEGIFKGETINTPSMLAVEDALDGLRWATSIGGLPGLMGRARRNLGVLEAWVEATPWVEFLARDPHQRSPTSICLEIVDPGFTSLDRKGRQAFVKQLTDRLAAEGVAHDIGSYRDAPPGLRIWGGATVQSSDLELLTAWLDWAFAEQSVGGATG